MERHKTVEAYIESLDQFQDEIIRLREILTSTSLVEEVKWGMPCYTHNKKLVVGISSFKSYFGLWFYQGALLSDPQGVLINAQQGKTKAMRQWRMNGNKDIKPRYIKAYVKESIGQFDAGKSIQADRTKPLHIPAELQQALDKNKKAKAAFAELTKGKQREYADHIADAKRADTKTKRLEKILPMIVAGKALNDKYRNC